MLIITIRNRNICLYGAVVFREYRKMGWIDDDEIYVGHNEAYELLFSRPFACLPFYFSSGSTTYLTLSLYAAMCTNFLVVPNIKIVILMTRPLLVSLKLNSFFSKAYFHFHMEITHEVDCTEDYPLERWRKAYRAIKIHNGLRVKLDRIYFIWAYTEIGIRIKRV